MADITQLRLPFEKQTASDLTRTLNGIDDIKRYLRTMAATLAVHGAALDLILPAALKADSQKLAIARELLAQAERRAS